MLASWRRPSGATRTSVVRTTPTMASVSGRQKTYPPALAAAIAKPSTTMPASLRLAMQASPPDHGRGNHREHEIDDGQDPEALPVVNDLPQARPQLFDAHDAIDGEIRREYEAHGKDGFGDCFARPGKTRQEQLRKRRAEEDEGRGLWSLEPRAYRLGHEAGRKNEHRRQRQELQRVAEPGKAVGAGQHDEVQRERGQIDGQMR